MAENEIPDTSGIGGIVPHFYYDLLGRIVPGLYLLVAGHWLVQLRGRPPELGNSLSWTAVAISAFAAYAISFVLGPLSHRLFDPLVCFDKNDADQVQDVLKKSDISHPVDRQKKSIHDLLVDQSELCGHKLWLRAPQLAIICSRWDAEAFTARQMGMVSIILIFVTFCMMLGDSPPEYWSTALMIFIVVTGLSMWQFQYSRRRAVLARFSMLRSAPPKIKGDSDGAHQNQYGQGV